MTYLRNGFNSQTNACQIKLMIFGKWLRLFMLIAMAILERNRQLNILFVLFLVITSNMSWTRIDLRPSIKLFSVQHSISSGLEMIFYQNLVSSKLPDSFTPIAQKYELIHSVTKRRCTYCGKLHRDGKCITHPRRTPYIKKNGKDKKIKNIDSSSYFHAGDPAKKISVSNQAPTVDTFAVNSEIKFSHACHEGGTNLTGQRHSLCKLNVWLWYCGFSKTWVIFSLNINKKITYKYVFIKHFLVEASEIPSLRFISLSYKILAVKTIYTWH